MKKQFVFILLLVTFAISCLALVGCAHSHEFGEWTLSKRATCTEDGQQERFCSCGEKQTSTIAATGHSFGDWSVDKEPTCTEAGQEIKSCSCGETQTRSIDALGHTYQHVVSQPTCLEQGYTTHTCSICGYSYVDSYVDATGHNFLFDVCTICDYANYSTGLEMERVFIFPAYFITGIGTCTDTDIIIPSSIGVIPVTSIGDHAFYKCDTITSITIPSSVTSIDEFAFYGCSNLKKISIPSSVKSIDDYAFDGCTNLEYYEYDNAYYLGNEENNFVVLIKAKSPDISSCKINSNTKMIYNRAFSNCTNLTKIKIPNSVAIIGDYAFANCTNLSIVSFEDGSNYTSVGNYVFEKCTSLSRLILPSSVTQICSYAFIDCSSLTSITIPSGVTSIGHYAFAYCSSLASVRFEDPNGWYCVNAPNSTHKITFSLKDTSTNATYLRDTYDGYYWYKEN